MEIQATNAPLPPKKVTPDPALPPIGCRKSVAFADGRTEIGRNAVPRHVLGAARSFFHFIFGDLLISSPAGAAQEPAGNGKKLFSTAANPGAPSGRAAHHQGVIRDIMGDNGSGAHHGPTPNGHARKSCAAGSHRTPLLQHGWDSPSSNTRLLRGRESFVKIAPGPMKTSSSTVRPFQRKTPHLTVTRLPIRTPPSIKVWSQILQSSPRTAPPTIWAKAHTRVPWPIETPSSISAFGCAKYARAGRSPEAAGNA